METLAISLMFHQLSGQYLQQQVLSDRLAPRVLLAP
jgi:hypothetical protein